MPNQTEHAIPSPKIIAIIGMSCSGKSSAIESLTDHDATNVYLGGMFIEEMQRRGIEITPDNERIFAKDIRKTEGKDWAAKQTITKVHELIDTGQKRIILDGVCSWTEYTLLRSEFKSQITFIAIVAHKALRYTRAAERTYRPLSNVELCKRDLNEIENLEKGGPIAAADFYVLNNGSPQHLHDQLQEILRTISF